MFVNPAIPEITSFLGGVTKPYPFLHMTAPLLDDNTNIEDERNTNRKSVVELLQVDIHTDKEIKFTCKGKIKAIDCEEGWWYRACPRCKSSIQNLDDKLWCKNCRFIEALPIAWYRLRLIVEDKTGSATFVLFGRMAADLIGVPAHTLAASFKDSSRLMKTRQKNKHLNQPTRNVAKIKLQLLRASDFPLFNHV
ncbi:hypothetical protein M5689_024733 [Euphorbia peplus]|nr:hypothetical protein M5689_024733 [Euphorbia peplus]